MRNLSSLSWPCPLLLDIMLHMYNVGMCLSSFQDFVTRRSVYNRHCLVMIILSTNSYFEVITWTFWRVSNAEKLLALRYLSSSQSENTRLNNISCNSLKFSEHLFTVPFQIMHLLSRHPWSLRPFANKLGALMHC